MGCGEWKKKIQPKGCTIYFVARQTGKRYLAHSFTEHGTFIETSVVSNDLNRKHFLDEDVGQ
jgi:hypothetical protein